MRRSLLAILLVALCLFDLSRAQSQQIPFLPELLSRIEEFNRLYAEKRRAGVNLAAIEPLRKQGEAAFRSGNIPAILEMLGQGSALLQGRQWDERQRFQSSLTIETDRLVLEPNQELQVSFIRMFPSSLDKTFSSPPTVTLELQADAQSGGASGGDQPKNSIIIARQLAIAESSTMASRRVLTADGLYWVVGIVEAGGQKIAEIRKPLYAVSDFSDRLALMRKQLESIKSSQEAAVKAVAGLVPTPEFQLERLASLTKARSESDLNVPAELDRLEAVIAALAKGQNPYAGERGELERAYKAPDGKLVPYRVYVPKSYDAVAARPLVVMLHGALGDERTYFGGMFDPGVVKGEAERRGWILAAPNGRDRLSVYRGPGQEDVFDVIKAVSRDYKVDEARVYLTGHSLGAFGTWLVASSNPERFAAIAPVAGGALPQSAALKALFEKLKPVPALVAHGAKDGITQPAGSREMVAAAKSVGVKVEYLEVPDADHITVVAASFPVILDFFEKHTRQSPVK